MSKKNNFVICSLVFFGMTSCYRPPDCTDQTGIEVPCRWEIPIKEGMTTEDPFCFLWWEALNDPTLTSLIVEASTRNKDILLASLGSEDTLLKAVNEVSVEVAKNYMEFRGLQMQLKVLKENIKAQDEILTINKGLSTRGFFSSVKENEDQKNLDSFLMQKSLIEFSMEKTTFHLSVLLGYAPGALNEVLCQAKDLPELACNIPIGSPMELICRHPTVQQARKGYAATGSEEMLYQYQKAILSALEGAETALAAFNYERDKIHYLENKKHLKEESYQLIKDLYKQGLKDDRDVLLAYQELLSEEDALIQGNIELLTSYVDLYDALGSHAWKVCCD